MSRPLLTFLAVVVAVGAVIAVVAAATGSHQPAEVRGITASVEQTTAFQPRGLLEIPISNRSERTLSLRSLRLIDDRFEIVEPTARTTEIAAGPRRVMIPLPFGAPRCGDAGSGDAGSGGAVIEVIDGDGERIDVPVDADGEQFLAVLHERQCGQRLVRETVGISFTGPFEPLGDATVGLSVRIDRLNQSDEPVALEAMRGTVVFTVVVPGPGPLLSLGADEDGGTDGGTVPIVVSASRCDAHALIESKKSYRFPMWVSVGEAPARYLEVEPEGEARTVLEEILQEGCF